MDWIEKLTLAVRRVRELRRLWTANLAVSPRTFAIWLSATSVESAFRLLFKGSLSVVTTTGFAMSVPMCQCAKIITTITMCHRETPRTCTSVPSVATSCTQLHTHSSVVGPAATDDCASGVLLR